MKKIISAALVTILCMGMLSGCGSAAVQSNVPSQTSKQAGFTGGSMSKTMYDEYMNHCEKYATQTLDIKGKVVKVYNKSNNPNVIDDFDALIDVGNDGSGVKAQIGWSESTSLNDNYAEHIKEIKDSVKVGDTISATGTFGGAAFPDEKTDAAHAVMSIKLESMSIEK